MNIFFSGIGGVSMSGLALIALTNNHNVYGSDIALSENVNSLVRRGAMIYKGHSAGNIREDIDVYVYTAAVKEDNPEYIRAKELGIKMQSRAEFLGSVMKGYLNPISIAGTHGKTTTTSMLSTIMINSNQDPTVLVGGNLGIINGNVRIGNTENFITEACEYTNSFLNFESNIGVVLNIEADHLDFFKDLNEIQDSFNKFGKLINKDGYFIINGDDVNTGSIDKDVEANIIRFGKNEDNNVVITVNGYTKEGYGRFSLEYNNEDLGEFNLSVPGEHNVYNATAAIMASYVSGVSLDDIKTGIEMYTGVGRRFEDKGNMKIGAKIIDDYAHHPTEIKATLKAVKNMGYDKTIAIFQSHTYTRTESLLDEFAKSFNDADVVIIADIYAAREKFTDSVSGLKLADEIRLQVSESQEVLYIGDFDSIVKHVESIACENDIVLTIGAGDVYKVGEMLRV